MTRPSRLAAPRTSRAVSALFVLMSSTPSARAQPEVEDDAPSPADVERALQPEERTPELPAPGTSTAAPSVERLRQELREDLRDSLRRELLEELREELLQEIEDARGAPLEPKPAPIEDDSLVESGWMWEEPPRPELNLLELDGYFRFRYDFFNDLDLSTYYLRGGPAEGDFLEQGPFVPGLAPPTALCNTDVRDRGAGVAGEEGFREPAESCFNRAGEGSSLGGANIRFRLEPTLNVYEDIKIKSQIDIFDNLVLGSTPDSLYSPLAPLSVLTQTQVVPTAGVSTIWRDSIRVKRAWAEVMTPLGQLAFGRMPNHVGMGITANDGNGLDQDYGDSVDRLTFAAKIGDFLVAPAFDWAATGPTSMNLLLPQGQPFDREQRDDVDQYVLTISKQDSPEVIERKLANDEVAFDFGTQQILRIQALDSQVVEPVEVRVPVGNETLTGTADISTVQNQATSRNTLERDAQIYLYNYWATLRYRKLTISAEYAGVIGRIGNVAEPGPYGTQGKRVFLNQHGGALRASYVLLNDQLTLELMVLAASGDDAPGWGVFPLLGAGTTPGAWDGNQAPPGDDSITNFRFDPDFIIDLIFWRQLVGLVTDAFVVRPSVQYDLTDQLGGRLDIIYSRSWFGSSTPSGSFANRASPEALGGFDENLGIEADISLFYESREGFNAMFQYGIFIPMDGLDRQVFVEQGNATFGDEPVQRLDAAVAHTLQVLFAVTF